MTVQTIHLTPELGEYLQAISIREHELLTRLRNETADHPLARMQIAPEQGQLMALLIRLMGAKRIIEIGVFTGYSSLAMALAMPDDGYLLACDINDEYTSMARRYWAAAGVEHKIALRLAPALETLNEQIETGQSGTYDFAFIDADKENGIAYYEHLLKLIRPGGLITVDNTLWSGRVIDPTDNDSETQSIREFNKKLKSDSRVDLSIIPIGDGLTLAMKR